MMTAPEDTVVGDFGANDATDNATAMHSHSQLQSGARLVLHNASVIKGGASNVLCLNCPPPNAICPCKGVAFLAAWRDEEE